MFAQLCFAQAPNGAIPNSFFGMTFPGGQGLAEYNTLISDGLTTTYWGSMGKQSAAQWDYIEPFAPDSGSATTCSGSNETGTKYTDGGGHVHCYFWEHDSNGPGSGGLDSYVGTATAHSLPFMYMNTPDSPPWAVASGASCRSIGLYDGSSGQACDGPIASGHIADFQFYVKTLVQRYDGTKTVCGPNKNAACGTINGYELSNEDDFYRTGVTDAQFATYLDQQITAIKSVSSTLKIVCCGNNEVSPGDKMDRVWSALKTLNSAHAHYDVYSYHGYPHTCCTYPEFVATNASPYGNGYCSNVGLIPCVQSFISRNNVTTFSGGTPAIWDTEGSWGSTPGCASCGWFATDAQMPAYLGRFLLLSWSLGTSQQMWSYPNGGSQYGQLEGIPANVTAYQQIHNWMRGSTVDVPCAIASGTVWTCHLTKSGVGYLAVWNTAGSSTYTPASGQYTQYKDLAGNTTTLGGTVSIGTSPILLVGGTVAVQPPLPPTNLTATPF